MLLDLAAEDDDDLGDGKATRPTQAAKAKPDTTKNIPEDMSSDPTANQKKAMAIVSQLMLSDEIQHRQIKEKFNVDSRTQLSDIQWGQYAGSLTKLRNGWSANMGGDGSEVDAFFKAMKETTPASRIALLKFFTVDNVLHITKAQFAMWKVVLDDIIAKAAQPEL
jgi:hypothetical protein